MRLSIGIRPGTRRVTQTRPTNSNTSLARKTPKSDPKVETGNDFWKHVKKEPIVEMFDEGGILSIIADGLPAAELQDFLPFGKIVQKSFKNGVSHVKIIKETKK